MVQHDRGRRLRLQDRGRGRSDTAMIKPLCTSSLIELLYIVRCSCYGDIHSPEIKLFGHWYHKRLLPCVLPRVADLYLNSSITYDIPWKLRAISSMVLWRLVCWWFNSWSVRKFLGHTWGSIMHISLTFWKWFLPAAQASRSISRHSTSSSIKKPSLKICSRRSQTPHKWLI